MTSSEKFWAIAERSRLIVIAIAFRNPFSRWINEAIALDLKYDSAVHKVQLL
ncbi:hypothetical protein [Pseudanabaena sp. UWO310]|uniref:hypothetical protein n=1 Tax=Pseudanabaena sp. UWO310 TaxID=2480795 RepID=UPI001680C55B|nr:hypothetical protein [Pseudanabaena sp. UWO310]